MQAAKDSFYMALRTRLAALNPTRTMVIDGVTVPAIVARENMEPRYNEAVPGVFYTGVDRGRVLAEMDRELLLICNPPHTEMLDYTQTPSDDLGTGVFWTMPQLGNAPGQAAIAKQQWSASEARVTRYAQLRIYFFLPEVEA